jgi:manganese/iron transport system permease protein
MGVVLVVSLLVGPAITAYLLVKELHQMILLLVRLGVLGARILVYMLVII